jgi:hypothetical protein
VSRVLAAGRTPTVLAATATSPTAGGLLVSADDGRTFTAATWLAPPAAPPAVPVAAAVSRAGPATVLVAVPAGPALTALWRSTDGGLTLTPYGTVPAAATALAYDAGSADVVWLAAASGPGAGLWRSPTGGAAWTRVLDGAAYDVDTAPRATGGLVVVARDTGVWSSTDGAATWTHMATAAAATALRVDNGGPGAVALTGAAPVRATPGRAPAPLATGLPSPCAAAGLAADGALPATFTVRCGAEWYVLVSATDLAGAGGGVRPGGGLTGVPGLPLSMLRTLSLPNPDGTESGSLTFDGRALYYAGAFDGPHPDRVHLMSPVDGRDLGDLVPHVRAKLLAYDSRHDRLFVDDGTAMWRVDPATGTTVLAFPSTYGFQHSYDAATRTFVGVYDGDTGKSLHVVAESGLLKSQCSLTPALDAAATTRPYPSSVVAATDGAYVVLEDDATIVRVGRDCRLQATYRVPVVSESTLENDELVCDPLTFAPRTALWIRDSGRDKVIAYELPQGYCPFVSTLRLAAPRVVRHDAPAHACATLTGTRGRALAGQPVSFDVAEVSVAAPPTDARGRTCAALPATIPPGRAPVRARYAGTPQWTPATATAVTTVLAAPRTHREPPVAGSVAAVVAPAGLAAPAADPPGPPNAPAEPVPGQQPQAQANGQQHPAQQPGVQAGVAPGEDDKPALVLAGAEDERRESSAGSYAMSYATPRGAASRDATAAAVVLAGAAAITAAGAWGVRHQQSSAPAWVRAGRGRPRTAGRRGHAVRGGRR